VNAQMSFMVGPTRAKHQPGDLMPEKKTIERAREDARAGKAPSTQAGEFVREEIEHVREGKHGARSTKQAIAIGLSKARRAGVKLPPPAKGTTSEKSRQQAAENFARGQTSTSGQPRKRGHEQLPKRWSAKGNNPHPTQL
jgi:hypothetical protein